MNLGREMGDGGIVLCCGVLYPKQRASQDACVWNGDELGLSGMSWIEGGVCRLGYRFLAQGGSHNEVASASWTVSGRRC